MLAKAVGLAMPLTSHVPNGRVITRDMRIPADMSWLENEAFLQMYERGGFMATDDGALVMLAGSTLGGGK
jgi:hypothetical protein